MYVDFKSLAGVFVWKSFFLCSVFLTKILTNTLNAFPSSEKHLERRFVIVVQFGCTVGVRHGWIMWKSAPGHTQVKTPPTLLYSAPERKKNDD